MDRPVESRGEGRDTRVCTYVYPVALLLSLPPPPALYLLAPVYLSVYLSLCLFIYLSFSIYLSLCLFIYLCTPTLSFGPNGTNVTASIDGNPAAVRLTTAHTSLEVVVPAGSGANKTFVIYVSGVSRMLYN